MKRVKPYQMAIGVAIALGIAPAVAELIDFDTAELQSAPAGWITTMTHEGDAPRWQIEHDATSRGGGRVLAQLSTDRTSQRFPLAILAVARVADGEIRVRLKPVAGRVDQAAGLVWRYRDENNYYVVRANALENNVVAYKVKEGERSALAPIGREGQYGMEHDVPSDVWSTLGVVFRGSRFTVSFDSEELFQVEDSTFADAGKVGLWTKADSVTYFDDFEVLPSRQ